jgi:hypothetical protein
MWGHLKEYAYALSPRTIKHLLVRIQADVTTINANVLWHVGQNSTCALPSAITWTEATSDIYCDWKGTWFGH